MSLQRSGSLHADPAGPRPAGGSRRPTAAHGAPDFASSLPRAFHTSSHAHLVALRRAFSREQAVSGQALARALGRSRTAVWKGIEQLRQLGYRLEGSPRRGYRLLEIPDIPFPWEVELVRRGRFGCPLTYLFEVGSTNDEARRLALQGAPEGTVVVADRQLRGRGRRGREWLSPPGGLWFSVVLRPQVCPSRAGLLAMAAGLAVLRAASSLAPAAPLQLKWPNDVLAGEGGKLAGVLVELEGDHERIRHAVAGIGINMQDVSPPGGRWEPDRPVPVGLARFGCSASRAQVLAAVLWELEQLYDALHRTPEAVVGELERCLAWKGQAVSVQMDRYCVHGRLRGLDPATGALVLEGPDGRLTTVTAGDVSLRPGAGSATEEG
ncbi:MAG TPA: biotin--[acetyl-CoA-carboxylase] ligase [Limnochordales bacterium]